MKTLDYSPKGYSGKTWMAAFDVHEMPDLANLPVPEWNQERHHQHLEFYKSQRSGYAGVMGARDFYFGRDPNVQTLDHVDERLNKGWAEGGEKALGLADGLIDKVSQPLSIRRRVKWSDDGDEFDKERLIDGHLDTAWRTTSRQVAVATPIINIAVGWGGNAHMSHEQLFWSGAAAIALVRILEAAGYQTSLTALSTNRQPSGRHVAVICRVKQAGEYLRPDAVASTLCFATTFRTYVFLAIISSPGKVPGSLGSQVPVDTLIPHAIEAGMIDAPQIVLPDTYNEDSARRAVKNALAELQAANLAALPEGLVEEAQL